MLTATQDLLSRLAAPDFSPYADEVTAAVDAIVRRGGPADLAALQPGLAREGEVVEMLLPVVMAHGGRDHAQALAARWLQADGLGPGAPEGVLHALGYLHYTEAEPLLRRLARAPDYYVSVSACRGLLSFDCSAHATEIRSEILSYAGRNLFPELYPALASQTGDRDLVEFLFELGETTASSDCNGGLLLGLALFGAAGAHRFADALFSPTWEAGESATGSRYWAYWGMRYQGWSAADLLRRLDHALAQPSAEPRTLGAAFDVVLTLVELAVESPRCFIRGIPDTPLSWAWPELGEALRRRCRQHVPDSPWHEAAEALVARPEFRT